MCAPNCGPLSVPYLEALSNGISQFWIHLVPFNSENTVLAAAYSADSYYVVIDLLSDW